MPNQVKGSRCDASLRRRVFALTTLVLMLSMRYIPNKIIPRTKLGWLSLFWDVGI